MDDRVVHCVTIGCSGRPAAEPERSASKNQREDFFRAMRATWVRWILRLHVPPIGDL